MNILVNGIKLINYNNVTSVSVFNGNKEGYNGVEFRFNCEDSSLTFYTETPEETVKEIAEGVAKEQSTLLITIGGVKKNG